MLRQILLVKTDKAGGLLEYHKQSYSLFGEHHRIIYMLSWNIIRFIGLRMCL